MARTVVARSLKAKLLSAMLLSAAPLAAASSCGADEPADGLSDAEVGSVGLELTLPDGTTIDRLNYDIVGPNGYAQQGSAPLGAGSTLSVRINGLPVGRGYTITVSSPDRRCVGSASFDIAPVGFSPVALRLRCMSTRAKTGAIQLSGQVNVCPVVESAAVMPTADAAVFRLVGEGSDEDGGPQPISYRWQVSGGTLEHSNSTETLLHCPATGEVTVSLEVSDSQCGEVVTSPTRACIGPKPL